MATEARTDESTTTGLRAALRKARAETAERSAVIIDLRVAELTRLDLLKEKIEPLIAGLPETVEMFDLGITRGDPARLFIDMVAFIEFGRDRRTFRFVQDTRYGRALLIESDEVEAVVEAVTNYIARRLVERERALAADTLVIAAPPTHPVPSTTKTASRAEHSAKGFGAAVFAAFALGAVAGSAAILSFGWFWANGSSFMP